MFTAYLFSKCKETRISRRKHTRVKQLLTCKCDRNRNSRFRILPAYTRACVPKCILAARKPQRPTSDRAAPRTCGSHHRNGGPAIARASCGTALSLESGARSPRTGPFWLGYLPPGGSTSSTQQRQVEAVFGVPSHRQHRVCVFSFLFPRSSSVPIETIISGADNRSVRTYKRVATSSATCKGESYKRLPGYRRNTGTHPRYNTH